MTQGVVVAEPLPGLRLPATSARRRDHSNQRVPELENSQRHAPDARNNHECQCRVENFNAELQDSSLDAHRRPDIPNLMSKRQAFVDSLSGRFKHSAVGIAANAPALRGQIANTCGVIYDVVFS